MRIEDLIEAEAAVSEADMDADLKPGTVMTRGHSRTRTLQVRLNDDELAELTELATKRGVPASTLARELLMNQVRAGEDSPQALIARLRTDLATLAASVA